MNDDVDAQAFSPAVLELDGAAEESRIVAAIEEQVFKTLRRKGAVVGISGGIDSSVVATLLVRALGAKRVLGLLMPESESADDTVDYSRLIADHLGIETVHEDITPILDACGCYRRRDEAVRLAVPEYGPGYKCKIVWPNLFSGSPFRIFSVVVRSPDGEETRKRLGSKAYHGIVAATNFKQRVRKMLEYHHADRLDFAVAGTPNRLEYDQGFFVKNGDGAADLKPIAHLYKSQVYQLASHLGVPDEIVARPPTTDTYSLEQSQDEFYFSLPYDKLDLCLWGKNHEVPAEDVAAACELTADQVALVYDDIDAKRRATEYLHTAPLLAVPSLDLDRSD